MKTKRTVQALAATLALILAVSTAAAGTFHAAVVVRVHPPAPRLVIRPARPAPGYVWVSGRWKWNGRSYVWVSGRWVRPPYTGAVWVTGRWKRSHGGWVWVAGHWRT